LDLVPGVADSVGELQGDTYGDTFFEDRVAEHGTCVLGGSGDADDGDSDALISHSSVEGDSNLRPVECVETSARSASVAARSATSPERWNASMAVSYSDRAGRGAPCRASSQAAHRAMVISYMGSRCSRA
jgi:hypothetical protein